MRTLRKLKLTTLTPASFIIIFPLYVLGALVTLSYLIIFSDDRYKPLENYQEIPDDLENPPQSLVESDDDTHRDSSHYTIPNMTYAGNCNYEKDWRSPKN